MGNVRGHQDSIKSSNENKINWRLVFVEGFLSLIFSFGLSTAVSTIAYLMLTARHERGQGQVFNMTNLEAAPRFAAIVYVVFFLTAMLALTRIRVRERASARPRLHWALALLFYALIGLAPGLIYWLMLSAADRPGI